ncbi:hypothetical protein N657DRAFT_568401 [Parathielavia appendiculata]|uniref:Transcription factor domain-containing protein n=1 Tax=Parathielavia appendiculata TaxID=2587402 RepID=A0AAN6U3C3_9PEZI|nr:hypothetical protein N657DRAFT_568401 [Parathielavia appendiculata]
MMLRHTTLPPFIHPRLLFSPIADNDDDLEPLHNCISLMHMLNSRVAGSRKLFWRNVRMECERFCAENSTWNRWKWLAALQALCVYLILRLDEGQTEHNNFDYLMVAAVAAISSHLNTPEMTPSSNGRELTWKDWIFEESRRRLCVIYQILNLLVFFEPANMCSLHESQLLLAPLPAKRPLWEAADEASWRAESEKDAEAQVDFGLATSGELVKLQNGLLVDCHAPMEVARPGDAGGSSAWSAARWDEWSAGMDGFGGLVMLAASMLG